MITMEQLEAMKSVDIRTVDKSTLVDVRGFGFNSDLSQRERMEESLERVKNPYCFRCGDLAVKVEFTEDGPDLSDLLVDFLIRKKSGL